jgi:hypothetical protein
VMSITLLVKKPLVSCMLVNWNATTNSVDKIHAFFWVVFILLSHFLE